MKRRLSNATGSVAKRLRKSAGKQAVKKGVRSLSKSALGHIARLGGRALPAIATGLTGYEAYKAGRDFYQWWRSAKNQKKGSMPNSKVGPVIRSHKAKQGMMDKCAREGFVSVRETGDVVTDSTNQVVYVAHSTMPQRLVAFTVWKSIIKKLFMHAGITIKNDSALLVPNQYYDSTIRLTYKLKDGGIENTLSVTVTAASSTLDSVATSFYTQFNTWAGTSSLPSEYLRLSYYVQFGTLADAPMLQSSIDLTGVRVAVHSKSILKVQNRTINSTGNDTSEDVDNVPLHGKFFEFRTNSTVYRDYSTPAAAGGQGVATHPTTGVLPALSPQTTGTKMYDKIPLVSQFVGCRKTGTSKLDPGEIRSSILVDKEYLTFHKLMFVLYGKSNSTTNGIEQFWIGKTRMFGYEKYINAVAMSATNQFNLAYEHFLNVGVICYCRKNYHTAPGTSTVIGGGS